MKKFVGSGGIEVKVRPLAPDTMNRITASVQYDRRDTKPAPPQRQIEVGPGVFDTVEDATNAEYLAALAQWEAACQEEVFTRWKSFLETYALKYTVDSEAVNELRVARAAAGIPFGESVTDAEIFLWDIAFPDPADQLDLMAALFGKTFSERIEAQKEAFFRQLSET